MILTAPTLADAAEKIVGTLDGTLPAICSPDDPRHGTRAGYDAHRRVKDPACDPCKRAAAREEARRQLLASRGVKLRLHPCTIQRRLQALVAIGYSYQQLDRELQIGFGHSRQLAVGPRAYVRRETYDKVRAVYDRLCMTPAPRDTQGQRQGYTHAIKTAQLHGFAPPLAWDDDKIDDPDAKPYVATVWGEKAPPSAHLPGYPVDKLQARAAILRDCHDRRTTAQAAARELGMSSKDTLEKWCAKHEGFCGILKRMYGDLAGRDVAIIPSQKVA